MCKLHKHESESELRPWDLWMGLILWTAVFCEWAAGCTRCCKHESRRSSHGEAERNRFHPFHQWALGRFILSILFTYILTKSSSPTYCLQYSFGLPYNKIYRRKNQLVQIIFVWLCSSCDLLGLGTSPSKYMHLYYFFVNVSVVDRALLDRQLSVWFSHSSYFQKPGWETCCDIAGTDTSACDRQI